MKISLQLHPKSFMNHPNLKTSGSNSFFPAKSRWMNFCTKLGDGKTADLGEAQLDLDRCPALRVSRGGFRRRKNRRR